MLAVLGYRTAAVLARVLPAPLADGLAVATARLAYHCRVPARAALEGNLARLFPGTSARVVRRHARRAFERFGCSFAAFLRGPRPGEPELVGGEHLARARASGRGVIVLSAHLGHWEGGAAALVARGCALHLAARPQASPPLERLFSERRGEAGVRVLPGGPLLPSAAAVLRRGEWVALMADRGAARAGGASVCAWAGALAERTGALVLPAVCVRGEDGTLRLHVEAPLEPRACRDGAFRDTMRAWLERWPDQWAGFEALPEGLA